MCKWLRRLVMDEDDDRMFLEIDRHGALYFLLNAAIGSYNRRTDVIARASGAQEAADLDKIDASINAADAELKKD